MEMRSSRAILERQYLPWDPLQLSEEVDSGRRVRLNHVTFRPFRAFKRILLWTALQDKNLACITTKQELEEHFLKQLFRLMNPLRESVTVACYDFTGSRKQPLLALDDDYSFVTYHPYNESLSHLLSQLLQHRMKLRKAVTATRYEQLENKELQFIFLFLSQEQMVQLVREPLLRNMISSLLTDSHRERLYLGIFGPPVEGFTEVLLPELSQCYFLGQEASLYARNILKDWPVSAHSFMQELVGYGVFAERQELVSLHWADFTLSDWGVEFRRKREEDEALYREFLNSKADT